LHARTNPGRQPRPGRKVNFSRAGMNNPSEQHDGVQRPGIKPTLQHILANPLAEWDARGIPASFALVFITEVGRERRR
jgi:hypothetical protein